MTNASDATDHPARIGDRYELATLLGEGGMARVYRARDLARNCEVALKLLTTDPQARERATTAALFEREFHTLTQLRHPHVISVYDYGLAADGSPYYTMELLAGGDLRERAPLPWRDACRLMFDACSSLALLHSRRLLHRDISPRNIRCTPDGRAKLIDFGAMAPMSAGGSDVVGTPAFTAPETLHRLALDARTDLYSLGATLYFALTRRLPYPARTFADVMAAWSGKVLPPSAFVAEIPTALDDLVLALINPEPALRPKTTFDVMQQLAACAGLAAQESEAVSRAYLVTPTLVGRAELIAQVRQRLSGRACARATAILIAGDPGTGRSRVLDASAIEAKTLGFTVLRASASGCRAAFAVAHALSKHLLEALPSSANGTVSELFAPGPADEGGRAQLVLKDFVATEANTDGLQQALCRWLSSVARKWPLLLAVDDAQRMDPASAAVLAALIDKTRSSRLCVALTADSGEAANDVLSVLARRCERFTLPPLTRQQTHELLGSLFGDVAHLGMLSDEVYRVASGNPRQSMDLAQWFLDRGLIRYAAGTWTLPSRLTADDLPSSAAGALAARIAGLSEHARFLAQSHALAYYEGLTDRDYRALLPGLDSRAIEQAISELLWVGAVVSDGANYTLANRVWSAAFLAELTADQIERRHRALAAMYEPSSSMATIHHAFAGGLDELGLTTMLRQHSQLVGDYDHKRLLELNIGKMMWCAALACDTAQRLGYSPREVHDLRRWHFAGNITTEEGAYDESAQRWFEQLAHDSGLDLYRADVDTTDPGQRLVRALTSANQRYLDTPVHERVYAVDEAIRLLGEYVVCAIALGARTQDGTLLRGLPAILEPFVSLSPVLEVLWKNALATERSQCACQYEYARELWLEVMAKLETMTSAEFKHAPALRTAVAFALGLMEAHLGLPSAASWADKLDHDPYQRISALHLRKIVRLEQGDQRGADALRRQAEVLALQMSSPQMFQSLLLLEVAACAKARDLAGIAHVIEAMRPLAARHSGWQSSLINAEASFHLVRGDFDAARRGFEAGIELCALDAQDRSPNLAMWIAAQQGLAEVLLQTGNPEQARACASSALRVCEAKGVHAMSCDLASTLALAEARLGDPNATARLDALIAQQQQRGVTGLRLGLAFEARAQIAIWSDDRAAFEHYAELTAREYRHGARNPLAARYARLLNEAARRGFQPNPTLSRLENFRTDDSNTLDGSDLQTRATGTLSNKGSPLERAQGALEVVCAEYACRVGHLYLVTSQGVALAASCGEPPDPDLTAQVTAWLERERTQAEQLDDMDTGELTQTEAEPNTVTGTNVSYQLQPLRCTLRGVPMLAGVAAVAVAEARPRDARRGELLHTLAEHLLEPAARTVVQPKT